MRRASTACICGALALAVAAGAGAHAASTPTLAASASAVSFGQSVKLQGTIPGAAAGQQIQIVGAVCGFSGLVPVGETKTTASGGYSYSFQPMLNATLYAEADGILSRGVRVQLRPGVQLRKINKNTFGIDVSVGNGVWFTKPAILQRLDQATKTWKPVASAALRASSDPEAIVAVSSATVHASVKRGTQLRAAVPQATLGSCYLPSASAPQSS